MGPYTAQYPIDAASIIISPLCDFGCGWRCCVWSYLKRDEKESMESCGIHDSINHGHALRFHSSMYLSYYVLVIAGMDLALLPFSLDEIIGHTPFRETEWIYKTSVLLVALACAGSKFVVKIVRSSVRNAGYEPVNRGHPRQPRKHRYAVAPIVGRTRSPHGSENASICGHPCCKPR